MHYLHHNSLIDRLRYPRVKNIRFVNLQFKIQNYTKVVCLLHKIKELKPFGYMFFDLLNGIYTRETELKKSDIVLCPPRFSHLEKISEISVAVGSKTT